MDKKHNGPSVNPMLDSFVSKYDEATKRAIRERDDYAEELRAEVYKVEQERDALKAELPAVKYTLEAINNLKQERDALAMQNQQMRDALESLTHVEYALDLPLLQLRAIEALTLPDLSPSTPGDSHAKP